MRVRIVGAAAALLLSAGLVFAAPVGRLAPQDIQTTFFTGKPFTASTPSNVKFKMTFKPEGTMTRESLGKAPGGKSGKSGKSGSKSSSKTAAKGSGTITEGTWKLSTDGFCSTWQGSRENCYRVHESGSNKWAIVAGSQTVAYWSK